jgi:hypothetical protein
MPKFLKFSNRIVNTAFIRYVDIDQSAEKFTIHLDQTLRPSAFIFGTGYFDSVPFQMWASKAEHPQSYATIEKWIHSIECVSDENKIKKDYIA